MTGHWEDAEGAGRQKPRVDIYENKIRIALPVMCIDSESGKVDDSVRDAWDRFGGRGDKRRATAVDIDRRSKRSGNRNEQGSREGKTEYRRSRMKVSLRDLSL